MKIALLHLSDIHLNNRKCINNENIKRIAVTLYSERKVDRVLILISGDIAFSGSSYEYTAAKYLIGTLISEIKKIFQWKSKNKIVVICVPGNHDMNHSKNCSSNNNLQNIYNNNSYSDHLDNEYSKLHEYNNLARFNNCYFKGVRIRQFDFDGYSLQVVLFNSALFSLEFDEDKGLHYISPDELNKLSNVTEADFTIAMMHHSPDFLIDTQKQIIEKFICSKCNAFYYGHEHHSESKEVMYEGESSTIFELCGSLSNRGDWSKSSFYLNFLDTATEEYIQKKYNWDSQSSIYKCTYSTTKSIEIKRCTMFKLDERFSKDLYSDDKNPISQKFTDYFVFPRLKIVNFKDNNTEEILDFENFNKELMEKKTMRITGSSSSGKTALLKYCFIRYSSKFDVIFCDAEYIKGTNFSQIIKMNFQNNYGSDNPSYEQFTQHPKTQKMIIIDNIDCIREDSFDLFLRFINEEFEYSIFSTKSWIDCEIKNRIEGYFDITGNSSRYELTPFYTDKRKKLIQKVTEILCEDKLEADNTANFLLTCINKQKKICIPRSRLFNLLCKILLQECRRCPQF